MAVYGAIDLHANNGVVAVLDEHDRGWYSGDCRTGWKKSWRRWRRIAAS